MKKPEHSEYCKEKLNLLLLLQVWSKTNDHLLQVIKISLLAILTLSMFLFGVNIAIAQANQADSKLQASNDFNVDIYDNHDFHLQVIAN